MAGLPVLFARKSCWLISPTNLAIRTLSNSTKRLAAWNKDWRPGPYPETQEQREAAAKRYGLRVEDYTPYDPDNDPGYGDYPNIKWIGKDGRDPYEMYEYPQIGYGYGDTIHRNAMMSAGDRYNPEWEQKAYYSKYQMFAGFLSAYGGIFLLHCLCAYFDIYTHLPVMPKQYPDHLWIQRGKDPDKMPQVVHYTFEPAE